MTETITLQFDGGSRGNPGPAGVGVVLSSADGTSLVTLGRFIGRATNNVAEYKALITGLEQAKKLGVRKLIIRGDSELIIRQMTGEYRVKSPELRELYEEAQSHLQDFDSTKFEHNLRHKNAVADKLANLAMDRKSDVTDVDAATDDALSDAPGPRATQTGDTFTCSRCGCDITVNKPSSIRPHQLRPFGCQCGNRMNPKSE